MLARELAFAWHLRSDISPGPGREESSRAGFSFMAGAKTESATVMEVNFAVVEKAITSEAGFRTEPGRDAPCETSTFGSMP